MKVPKCKECEYFRAEQTNYYTVSYRSHHTYWCRHPNIEKPPGLTERNILK